MITPELAERVACRAFGRITAHRMHGERVDLAQCGRLDLPVGGVAILENNEEAMGPPWFYEGFAVYGAGQPLHVGLRFSGAEAALEAARDSESPLAYRRFVAALRYFTQTVPLPELVARAGNDDFEAWLLTLDERG